MVAGVRLLTITTIEYDSDLQLRSGLACSPHLVSFIKDLETDGTVQTLAHLPSAECSFPPFAFDPRVSSRALDAPADSPRRHVRLTLFIPNSLTYATSAALHLKCHHYLCKRPKLEDSGQNLGHRGHRSTDDSQSYIIRGESSLIDVTMM